MALADGLYDLLLTEDLARTLAALAPDRAITRPLGGDASERLAELVARQLAAILSDLTGEDDERTRRQLALVNALLVQLRQQASLDVAQPAGGTAVVDLVATPARLLQAVRRSGPAASQIALAPEIALGEAWLFTAGKGSPSLLQETPSPSTYGLGMCLPVLRETPIHWRAAAPGATG